MLLEALTAVEQPMTEIAFPATAVVVVRSVVNRVLLLAVPLEQLVGQKTTRVPLTKNSVDGFAVHVGRVWARSPLEMVREARGCREAAFAEGA